MENHYLLFFVFLLILLFVIYRYLISPISYIKDGYVGITPQRVYMPGWHYITTYKKPNWFFSLQKGDYTIMKNKFVIKVNCVIDKIYISYSYKKSLDLDEYNIKTENTWSYKTPFEKFFIDKMGVKLSHYQALRDENEDLTPNCYIYDNQGCNHNTVGDIINFLNQEEINKIVETECFK